ncbi:hypothetical protein BDZ94DRAFT_613211 [Collybia nuda]|uniref:Uncharacterized protein n=1 Tax=Collybia nuda TaxID=64659 RepID=A0A9P5Y6B1_9AGAR|nr:hypothetical protein BDZ94DRAFT_613211 [Collybia nuda]
MSSNVEILTEVGRDFNLKVARVVPGAVCYGVYLILMGFLVVGVFSERNFKMRGSNIFLSLVTALMFFGGTIFLCLDVSDLVRRMQIIMVNNPEETNLQLKLDQANEALKKLVWTGQMLFIFMFILGDSVVVWRTWTICFSRRKWVAIPIATWIGSTIAALFELGCDVHTHWAITDLSPSAASVGAETCKNADISSYTLSYVTNILCTMLIAYQTWGHRKLMKRCLGAEHRSTQVEKILTLIVESGSLYIVLYTLQAVPIYGADLTPAGRMAFNVVNAVVQQAIGIYPTVVIILVKMQKSLWETAELASTLSHSRMKFNPRPASIPDSRLTETTIGRVNANRSGDLEKSGVSCLH